MAIAHGHLRLSQTIKKKAGKQPSGGGAGQGGGHSNDGSYLNRSQSKNGEGMKVKLDDGFEMPDAWASYRWPWQRQKGF